MMWNSYYFSNQIVCFTEDLSQLESWFWQTLRASKNTRPTKAALSHPYPTHEPKTSSRAPPSRMNRENCLFKNRGLIGVIGVCLHFINASVAFFEYFRVCRVSMCVCAPGWCVRGECLGAFVLVCVCASEYIFLY